MLEFIRPRWVELHLFHPDNPQVVYKVEWYDPEVEYVDYQESLHDWMECNKAHGQFLRCQNTKNPPQPCSKCKQDFDDEWRMWRLNIIVNRLENG